MDTEERVIPLNTVFRIVWTDPPLLLDFQSNTALGVEPRHPLPKEYERLHDGISVYRTIGQARRTARNRPPWLGRGYIARVVIPIGAEIRIERTTKTAGHYTMWVDAEDMLSWVDSIEAVTPQEGAGHGL